MAINIHGEGFMACGKRQKDMTAPMPERLKEGLAVTISNYRLADETAFPEPVRDIKQTIRFLKANAPIHRLRPDQMAAWGGSASGYMTLMACLFVDDLYYNQELDPSLHVSAQIAEDAAWYPLTSMTPCNKELVVNSVINRYFHKEIADVCVEYEPTVSITLGSEFPFYNHEGWLTQLLECPMDSSDRTVRKASPLYAVHDYIPPVLIQRRSSDEIVPIQQSIQFALYVGTCCGKERMAVEILPNAVHSSVLFETKENLEWVLAFISDVLEIRESAAER